MKTMASLLACGALGLTLVWNSAVSAQAIEVQSAIVRMVPAGQKVSAAFFTLLNPDSRDRTLVAARSDAASAVEVHEHVMQDGLMKMRRVQSLMLPGHGSVTLEPGGLHLMLIGLTRALQLDEVILIELEFADGERVLVEAVVMMPGGSS